MGETSIPTGIDEQFLTSHRGFVDANGRFAETFVQPELGGTPTIGVVCRPLDRPIQGGFILCSSYASEQSHLARSVVVMARGLAAAGFVSLRWDDPGYGDSQRGMAGVGLACHLAAAVDALDFLEEEHPPVLGAGGFLFGGAVAALAAERRSLPMLAVWEPVVKGASYMRDFLRTQVFHLWGKGIAGGDGDEEGGGQADRLAMRAIREELATRGWVDIRGWHLTREAHDEIAALDLTRDLTSFRGSSLVVGVSRRGTLRPGHERLAEHLRSLGGACTVVASQDRSTNPLGRFPYATSGELGGRVDTHDHLNLELARLTGAWATEACRPPLTAQDRT